MFGYERGFLMRRIHIGLVTGAVLLGSTGSASACNINCQDFWKDVAEIAEFQMYANEPEQYFMDRIFFEYEEYIRRERGEVTDRELEAAWEEFVTQVNKFGYGGHSPMEPVDVGSTSSTFLGDLFTYPVAPSAPFDIGGVGPIGEAFNDGAYDGGSTFNSVTGGNTTPTYGSGTSVESSTIYNGSSSGYTSGSGSAIYNCTGSCGIGTIYNSVE
jgi:hypothetical protein